MVILVTQKAMVCIFMCEKLWHVCICVFDFFSITGKISHLCTKGVYLKNLKHCDTGRKIRSQI